MQTITLICLRRYGDILNCLPVAWLDHQRGNRVRWVVHKDYASLVQGLSYIDEVAVWDGLEWDCAGAVMAHGEGINLCLQVNRGAEPTRTHRNFCVQAWSYSMLPIEEVATAPLVLDNRATPTGSVASLLKNLCNSRMTHLDWPLVLFNFVGRSSEFPDPHFLDRLFWLLPGITLQNTPTNANKFQDLLALYERAACVVSVDTATLHLSYATKTPTVALVNNDPWLASEPRPHHILRLTYAEALAPGGIDRIAAAVKGIIQ